MGGNVFPTSLTSRISAVEARLTYKHFVENVTDPLGLKTTVVGSAFLRSTSSDLDVCVLSRTGDVKADKRQLLGDLKRIGISSARLVGSLVSFLYPIHPGGAGRLVQVDAVVVDDLQNASWLLVGSRDDEISSRYRNLLLSHVAKQVTSRSSGSKVTVGFPAGIRREEDGKLLEVSTDPERILHLLGVDATPQESITFAGLVSALAKHVDSRAVLESFSKYVFPAGGSLPRLVEECLRSALVGPGTTSP